MENTKHWAESLISGDRCLATIRHQTDGSKNKHNVNVIVVRNKIEINSILCTEEGSGVSIIIPYYELSQIPQPKQEKIEEETLSKIKFVLLANNDAQAIRILEQYAEFHKERMYSEEEVINLLKERDLHNCININGNNTWIEIPKWLEQFKKK